MPVSALTADDKRASRDLVLNTIGQGTHVFLNNGKGVFSEITKSSPLNLGRATQTLALADIDGDGKLDMYVANYRIDTPVKNCSGTTGATPANHRDFFSFLEPSPSISPSTAQ